MRSLINTDTGEIDHHAVMVQADLRATREYGGPNPPPRYIRESVSWMVERSRAERLQWRDHHGLPREDACVVFHSLTPDTNE